MGSLESQHVAPAHPQPLHPRRTWSVPTGVAEQFAITEATLSAWSSLDDGELGPESSPADVLQLQGMALGPGWDAMGPGWDAVGPASGLALLPEPWDLREAPPTLSLRFSSPEKGGW